MDRMKSEGEHKGLYTAIWLTLKENVNKTTWVTTFNKRGRIKDLLSK